MSHHQTYISSRIWRFNRVAVIPLQPQPAAAEVAKEYMYMLRARACRHMASHVVPQVLLLLLLLLLFLLLLLLLLLCG
jgi:hypothetical protein